MKDNMSKCMEVIFQNEGGMSLVRSDPGNWTGGAVGSGQLRGTKFGISAASHPDVDISSLTKKMAAAIYATEYWNPIRGDDLPDGLDLMAFDAAINSGPRTGVRWIQHAIGVAADGIIGPETIKAAQSCDVALAIRDAARMRLDFLRTLPTWTNFGDGWTNRVNRTEAAALAMVD